MFGILTNSNDAPRCRSKGSVNSGRSRGDRSRGGSGMHIRDLSKEIDHSDKNLPF